EGLRRAFVDRLHLLGDGQSLGVPYKATVTRAYAEARRMGIETGRATPDVGPGDPWAFERTEARGAHLRAGVRGDGQTTHINIVDRDRNMVSLTSTLGSTFGSAVVVRGTGITLNNATMWFDPQPGAATSISPGKH